jgi:hypothetical protein
VTNRTTEGESKRRRDQRSIEAERLALGKDGLRDETPKEPGAQRLNCHGEDRVAIQADIVGLPPGETKSTPAPTNDHADVLNSRPFVSATAVDDA